MKEKRPETYCAVIADVVQSLPPGEVDFPLRGHRLRRVPGAAQDADLKPVCLGMDGPALHRARGALQECKDSGHTLTFRLGNPETDELLTFYAAGGTTLVRHVLDAASPAWRDRVTRTASEQAPESGLDRGGHWRRSGPGLGPGPWAGHRDEPACRPDSRLSGLRTVHTTTP